MKHLLILILFASCSHDVERTALVSYHTSSTNGRCDYEIKYPTGYEYHTDRQERIDTAFEVTLPYDYDINMIAKDDLIGLSAQVTLITKIDTVIVDRIIKTDQYKGDYINLFGEIK